MTSVSKGSISDDFATTEEIRISFEDSETPNTVDTIIRINPIFNFHSANTLHIQLFIQGKVRESKLIRKDASSLNATFTIRDHDWAIKGTETPRTRSETGEVEVYDDTIPRIAEFAISFGSLADGATAVEQFVRLSGTIPRAFDTYVLLPSSHRDGGDTFYDAFSQVEAEVADEVVPDTFSDSNESVQDIRLNTPDVVGHEPEHSEHSEQDEIIETPMVIDHGTKQDDHDEVMNASDVINNEQEHSRHEAPIPRTDDMARLNRATRPLFRRPFQPDHDSLFAHQPARATAMSATYNTRKDIEFSDDFDVDTNLLKVNTTPIIRLNTVENSGKIGKQLSSGKGNAESGKNSEVADVDHEVAELDSDITPTAFTDNGKPRKRSASHIPYQTAFEKGASQNNLADEIGPDTEDNLPKKDTRDLQDVEKDFARKEKRRLWRAAGNALKRELLNLAASNDDRLHNGFAPKSRGVREFGTDRIVAATNAHILTIINKQVKLNLILIDHSGVSAEADIRRGLPKWKEDAIDEYERQLGAAIETAESYRPANPEAPARQSTVRESGTDLGDASSQTDETDMPDDFPALDLQVRIPASYTGKKRGSEALEEIDDDELPEVGNIGPRTSRTTPLRNDEDEVAEPTKPPAKKARGSMARLSFDF